MEANTTLALAGAIGIMIVGYLILDSGNSSSQKRVQSISGNKNRERSSMLSFMKVDDSSSRRKMIESSLGDLEQSKKDKQKKVKTLKSKLMQANMTMKPQTFITISVAIAIVAGGLPLLFGAPILLALGLGFVLGFGFPRFILNAKIARRQKKFTENFSDAMDIIVRGVRTGLPLGDCLRMIAHEAPEPIRSEFARLVEAEGVGVPIEMCIERMYDRIPLAEVNFFGTVLNIQRSTGGNLGESLANLSKVLRERKLLREKIKALSAEAKMSAIIIGVLPPGVMAMVTMSAPDYMVELYTTPTGHRSLLISAVMMGFGIFVMRKMINFKF